MPKYLDLVKGREEEVRGLIEWLSKRTKGFEEPKLVLAGGYGLRAFVPFSRSTRDCDFVLAKGEPWPIDRIHHWLPKNMSAAKLLPYPDILQKNLRNIIVPEIEDRRFLHSWRGMFITTDFTEETKGEVSRLLRELVQ
ncbi:MAG: hypothetical protein HY694_10555 [Deltaproteobacteria bacterium]|nr:hypothetical protein [Deltaproteobacteria bacterium]